MKKGVYTTYHCHICQPQKTFNKLEQLYDHMKEEHQGVLFPDKK